MKLYFDTNILIYALCSSVDNKKQQDISVELLEKAILDQNLVLSDLILCEFAFISKKLKENENNIIENIKFLSQYAKESLLPLDKNILENLEKTKLFNSSFDIYHLSFCEINRCKLLTFDKGFKKFQNISSAEIEIVNIP